ncbi:MAG: hypothetical protein KGS61_09670 [Verrucomicrobia bacterium]|nr:hypothetical protein [Verrucomicrobiota bacterium]
MDSKLSNLFLGIVGTGALLFTGYLISDYFSRAARSARRRKRHAERKLKRVRDDSDSKLL